MYDKSSFQWQLSSSLLVSLHSNNKTYISGQCIGHPFMIFSSTEHFFLCFMDMFLFSYLKKWPFHLKSNATSQDCYTHGNPSTGSQEDCKLEASLGNTGKHSLNIQPDNPPINLPNATKIKKPTPKSFSRAQGTDGLLGQAFLDVFPGKNQFDLIARVFEKFLGFQFLGFHSSKN